MEREGKLATPAEMQAHMAKFTATHGPLGPWPKPLPARERGYDGED